jgi:hypothetical protein
MGSSWLSKSDKSVFPPVQDLISLVSSNDSDINFELDDNEYADGSISLIFERSDGSGAFLSSIGSEEWNKPHSGHLNVPFVSSVPHDGQRTDASKENKGSPLNFIPQG